MNMPAREAAERAKELRGDNFQARLHPYAIKRADYRIAGQAAAEGAELVVGPHGKIISLAPEKSGANRKSDVAQQC